MAARNEYSWVPYVISILTLMVALAYLLASCGGPPESSGYSRHQVALQACYEFGYPEVTIFDDGEAYCLRKSECSDEVIKLTTLQARHRG